MNPWPFILGAYGVTLVVIVIEVLAVRARARAARVAATAPDPAQGYAAAPPRA